MTEILKDYGWCQVIIKDKQYFISYDTGGIAIQMKEIEIIESQAIKALIDQFEAEKIIKEIVCK